MIPRAYISEWNQQVPWQTMEQVEQDLVISQGQGQGQSQGQSQNQSQRHNV